MGRYDVLLQQEKTTQATPSVSTPAPPAAPRRSPAAPSAPELGRPAGPSEAQSSTGRSKSATAPPRKREFARRSFDFYADQVDYLTKASLQERLDGGESSMNAMVREAIDDYIKKRKARK